MEEAREGESSLSLLFPPLICCKNKEGFVGGKFADSTSKAESTAYSYSLTLSCSGSILSMKSAL